MKKSLLIISLFAFYSVQAQKVTGYWYGQANVEMAGMQNNYLTELIIAQKGNKVKGFLGYYFKDVYQSFLVKGTYDPKTRQVVIRNIPIIYFNTNSTINSVDCITSFYGTLMVSKVKTSLTGYFYRDKKYEYTCPDLRVNYTLFTEAKVEDSVFKDMASTRQFWKPHPDEFTAMASSSTAAKKEEKEEKEKSKAKEIAKEKEKKDTVEMESTNIAAAVPISSSVVSGSTNTPNTIKTTNVPLIRQDLAKIIDQFKKRKQVFQKEIRVESDSIRLSFYDNAEIDGDSISVFLNGDLVIAHQELTERAFNLYLKLDSTKEVNEVSMFAENLGKYPPNTALMVVSDGENRYETFLSSDFKGNATIKFKRKRTAGDKL
ncbi:MAG: hypothetical protein JST75_06140 [Bacteroidetes bacterium]|nr:hypothetical protein [Bacteroidota bacterium]